MVVLLPYILYVAYIYMFDQALAGLACSPRINQKVTMTADCFGLRNGRGVTHLLCALLAGPFELSPDFFPFVDIYIYIFFHIDRFQWQIFMLEVIVEEVMNVYILPI